jgi:hypothetical protein
MNRRAHWDRESARQIGGKTVLSLGLSHSPFLPSLKIRAVTPSPLGIFGNIGEKERNLELCMIIVVT